MKKTKQPHYESPYSQEILCSGQEGILTLSEGAAVIDDMNDEINYDDL